MTPHYNKDLARRACIARNQAKLADLQKQLETRRAKHGRTVAIMHRMEARTRRLLFLETGGDPRDTAFTRGLV